MVVQRAGNMIMQTQTTCDECDGEGRIVKDKCKECGGKMVKNENMKIYIVKDMKVN